MAVRLHGCARCGGTLVACEDGWDCLDCGNRLYVKPAVHHRDYQHVGVCECCGGTGHTFYNIVGEQKRWLCWPCCSKRHESAS